MRKNGEETKTVLDRMEIIQRNDFQNFTLDSVLLGDFVKINRKTKKILDIGTGCGIISLILAKKSKAQITGIELQPEMSELNPMRGFDHGAWAVLKYLYPDADIPVVQLSLNRLQSAEWHFNLAKKLSALREQGVLIIGSGNIVHNLKAISWEHIDQIGAGYDWAYAFRDHINHAITTQNNDELVHYEQFGEGAALSVPTPDHYLPLLYVMALREPDEKVAFFNDHLIAGSLSMTSVLVG